METKVFSTIKATDIDVDGAVTCTNATVKQLNKKNSVNILGESGPINELGKQLNYIQEKLQHVGYTYRQYTNDDETFSINSHMPYTAIRDKTIQRTSSNYLYMCEKETYAENGQTKSKWVGTHISVMLAEIDSFWRRGTEVCTFTMDRYIEDTVDKELERPDIDNTGTVDQGYVYKIGSIYLFQIILQQNVTTHACTNWEDRSNQNDGRTFLLGEVPYAIRAKSCSLLSYDQDNNVVYSCTANVDDKIIVPIVDGNQLIIHFLDNGEGGTFIKINHKFNDALFNHWTDSATQDQLPYSINFVLLDNSFII
jgi:hypothetical protein